MYGLSNNDFLSLLKSQKGTCAICFNPPRLGAKKGLCVDHDHDTGEIRGLLCENCNRGLGLLGDDQVRLQKCLEYLSKNK